MSLLNDEVVALLDGDNDDDVLLTAWMAAILMMDDK